MSRNGSSVIQEMLKRLAEKEAKDRVEQQLVMRSTETAEPARALTARQ